MGAAIILGWGAVYGYVAIYSLALWGRRRARREYRTFGLMSLALVVQCLGDALLVDASDIAAGQTAMAIRIVGAAFTLGFVHHAMVQLAGLERAWMVRACYAWAVVFALLGVTGLAFVSDVPAPAPTWGLATAPDYMGPQVSIAGHITIFCAWPFVASTIHALYRASQHDSRVRFLMWAVAFMSLSMSHDHLVWATSFGSYYLGVHATLLTVGAMGKLLVDRFTQTSTTLDLRTRELSTSYDELRDTEAALVKKEQLATVGELSGLIADQVEAPLSAIKATSQGLSREGLDSDARGALLDGLDDEVDRLNRLVDNLLSYARPVTPQIRPVAIFEMVSEVLTGQVPTDSNIDTDIDVDNAPAIIYADGDLLRVALREVVDNAVQAMPNGGSLIVSARPTIGDDGDAVVLEIHDSGIGMDAETIEKSREPFFTTEPLGTGLGLAIVERILAMHSGSLSFESEPGLGTVVHLEIPDSEPTSSISSIDGIVGKAPRQETSPA
ncbi:MAG: hypothetical protein JRH11_17330 [Deltaproteobacteria bacterium]|nr:hypothetical protein [Deltaproteobacteria bacterium]